MKKLTILSISFLILLGIACTPIYVKAEDSVIAPSPQTLIEQLKQQIAQLQTQIAALNAQLANVKQSQEDIKGTLQLLKQLKPGMSGEDVKLLQEVLASDPTIYPEGLITGYYGKLTEKAVKNFQKLANLDQVGNVGPKTLEKINELLSSGAGNSGKVPPGLLIAPGIRKKIGIEVTTPLPGQILPPGISKKINSTTPNDEEDTVPPVISAVEATDITENSAKISWNTDEESTSTVWYGTENPLIIDDSTLKIESSNLTTSHDLTISGLNADTVYYYVAGSADKDGNNDISEQKTFTTASQD